MSGKKRMLLVINPRSGREKIRNKLLEILDIFEKAGYEMTVHITQGPLDARDRVIREGAEADLVVCSGGDGTLNEVISGMMALEKRPPLGYIPGGSTNDFAAGIGIPVRMAAAAHTAVEGEDFPVDVGRFCGQRNFVYVAGFGAFTEVSYLTSQDKKNVLGHQAYVLEGMKSLTSIKAYPMRVTGDTDALEGEFIFGMVTNSLQVGGIKGLVSQDVSLNDGLFEVLLVRMPKTAMELGDIVTGILMKDEKNELVHKFKTRSLTVEADEPVDWVLDGEYGGSHRQVSIENLTRQLVIRRNPTKPAKNRKNQTKSEKKNVEI